MDPRNYSFLGLKSKRSGDDISICELRLGSYASIKHVLIYQIAHISIVLYIHAKANKYITLPYVLSFCVLLFVIGLQRIYMEREAKMMRNHEN